MTKAVLADRIAVLQVAFLKELADTRWELTALLTRNQTGENRERLIALTHSIAGRAGTFGFPELSEAAANVHDSIDADRDTRVAARILIKAVAMVLDPPPRA